ncbi:laccase [Moniliophthora roreri MCA 2997]|uniref:Laccase n=1 Tax=Moniliophthora roreri (strain MCA 2997) TaxID=1381753 RepID=V2X3Y4_MONRO|nr:laccase [Moniliophthora roreri MCA 2997]
MSRFQYFLILATFALPYVQQTLATIGPVADLVISNQDVSPDDFTRGAVVAGGNTIGPLIVGTKGDNLRINVINNLNDNTMLQSTSIHWHGIFQKTTNWADGAAFVNQCPIAKGNSFLYDFNVPDQAGTFWYHSHLSTQYCDGLRGALVIYDPNDPHASLYDVDDESTVITLADWYHAKAKQIVFGYAVGLKATRRQSSLLLLLPKEKGKSTGLRSTLVVVNNSLYHLRYRMRLVNTACDPAYTFSIDNHTMTVIETDTVNNVPLEVDSLRIYVGQRYSFVLDASQAVGNYWIRANPNAGTLGFANGINSAILRYVGAEEAEPPVLDVTSTNQLNEANLVTSAAKFTVNGVTFVPPTVPVLLQILSGAQTPDTLLPTGSVIPLPANATVELSMTGGLLGLEHPIHLHGHTFNVVRAAGMTGYNFANPIRRDVVNAGSASDNVTIRFRTDNPGPWIMHCHIDWHLENGFAIVFAERTDEWNTTINPTDAWDNLCPIYDALSEGDL